MHALENILIEAARAGDDEWCAGVMVTTDPWLTLGRDLGRCLTSLRRPGCELFVARRGEEPLGFILLHPTGMANKPYVALIAVSAPARGRGLGGKLLAFAETRYEEAGHIFLCVTNINESARRLYERVGYRKVGEIPDFSGEGYSELIMHKRIA